MNVLITGCTGFVGRQLVPDFLAYGANLTLAGRDVRKIEQLYPGCTAISYDEIGERAKDCEVVVHLAVLNNDAGAPIEQFRAVNVDQTVAIAMAAREAGIRYFINFSSFHMLDEGNRSPYAQSKREAIAALDSSGTDAVTVFLPAVYGQTWAGKLAVLNKFPGPLGRLLFGLVGAVKPVVSVRKISDFIADGDFRRSAGQVYLFDEKGDNPVYRFTKRFIDVAAALSILLLLWWLLLIVWAVVYFQSPGPGIFSQTRVGRGGRPFTCYKFRTMAQGTKQAGTHEVSASSVTPVGAFLRRTKLDELPQVWNILRNEVSLVGPRPCLPSQTELVAYRQRHDILRMKPGITGYAQINDIDMSDPARLTMFDARYLAMRSLVLDIKILLATVLGRGQGDRTA